MTHGCMQLWVLRNYLDMMKDDKVDLRLRNVALLQLYSFM